MCGRRRTVAEVLRRMRCSDGCGGRVTAAWLVTRPILDTRVRPSCGAAGPRAAVSEFAKTGPTGDPRKPSRNVPGVEPSHPCGFCCQRPSLPVAIAVARRNLARLALVLLMLAVAQVAMAAGITGRVVGIAMAILWPCWTRHDGRPN
jgi:hypothetical protein